MGERGGVKRMNMAILAIVAGLILLGRNLNLLPDFYCRIYLEWTQRYWPAVLILLGLQVMARDKYPWFSQAIKGLLLVAVVLWFICHITFGRTRVFY